MSQTVDNRIVEMEFDNAEFERGISTSIASLERLKESLNFEGAVKGFDALANFENSGKEGFENLKKGAEKVQASFSGMQIVGYTAIQELTKGVMGLGGKLLNFLTGPLAQIEAGGKKRAQNIEQARFQMQGLGLDVEEAMRNSLDAVDGTAYGLDAAAKAAGQLAASGVALGKDMTTSLRGIAGVASMTSSQFEEISPIFTTVAGQGKLMTMQLRQLENRGINAAATMAKAFGTTEAAVRQMVTDGEVSFEMFSKAMSDAFGDQATKANDTYAGSLMNVQAALSRIGAKFYTPYYENMRQTLNELRLVINAINAGLDPLFAFTERIMVLSRTLAVNRLKSLDFSGMAEGLTKVLIPTIDILVNITSGLSDIFHAIGEAWRNVFPPASITPLVKFLEYIAKLTSSFKLSEKNMEMLTKTFQGLFSVISIAGQVITFLVKGLGVLVSNLLPVGNGVLFVTGSLSEMIIAFDKALKSSNIFGTVLDKLTDLLSPLRLLLNFIAAGAPLFYSFAEAAAKGLGAFSEGISSAIENFDADKFFTMINGTLLGVVLVGIRNFVFSLKKVVKTGGNVLENLTGILDDVRGSLVAFQQELKSKILLNIAVAVGILAASLAVLSSIDPNKLAPSLVAMTTMFTELMASMALFGKFVMGPAGIKATLTLTTTLMAMSSAILLLSFAMKNLSDLDWSEVAKGLTSVVGLMLILSASAKIFSTISGSMMKDAGGLILFAAAILVLSKAVEKLGALDTGQMIKGLLAVAVLCAELSLFMKATNLGGMGIRSGAGILILAGAVIVLASAVRRFSEMDTISLIKGLAGVAVVLAELAIFIKLTGAANKVISTAIGLTILASAMLIFAKAIDNMGGMSAEQIAKGLITMAGALTIIGTAMALMKTSLAGAAALLVISTSLTILSGVLRTLGNMSIEQIVKSLLTLAGMFTVLGLAALVLTPVMPVLLALGAVIALIGVGALAAGAGLLMIAAGLTAISVSAAALSGGIVILITSLVSLIPMTFKALAEGVIAFFEGIASSSDALLAAVTTILITLLEAIKNVIPKISDTLSLLINTLLDSVVDFLPRLVQAGVNLLISFIQGIADNIPGVAEAGANVIIAFLDSIGTQVPRVVDAGFKMIISLITGMTDTLKRRGPELSDAMSDLAGTMLQTFVDVLFAPAKGVFSTGQNIVTGVIDGIKDKFKALKEAASNAGSWLLDALNGKLEVNSPSKATYRTGGYSADGLIAGVLDKKDKIKEAGYLSGSALDEAYNEALDKIAPKSEKIGEDAGKSLGTGITNGSRGKGGSNEAAKKAAEEALKAIHETFETISVSEGRYLVDGMIIGMVSKEPNMYEASRFLALAVQKGLIEETSALTGIGDTQATEFLKGMTDDDIINKAWAAGVKVSSSAWEGAKDTAEAMEAAGTAAGQAYIDGLNKAAADAAKKANDIANTASSGGFAKQREKEMERIRNGEKMGWEELSTLTDEEYKKYIDAGAGKDATEMIRKMKEAGENTSSGLADGITNGVKAVKDAITNLTNSVVNTAKDNLDIHSPSGVFSNIGVFSGMGFVNGLISMSSKVSNAAKGIGQSAIDGLNSAIAKVVDVINDDSDFTPVIRPVLDLDAIQNGMQEISDILNQDNEIAAKIANPKNTPGVNSEKQNSEGQKQSTTYQFTQNNYSPKPLSRIDIYRQTSNQFSAWKGLVSKS